MPHALGILSELAMNVSVIMMYMLYYSHVKLNMSCFQKQLAAIVALAHLGPYHACIWVGHI